MITLLRRPLLQKLREIAPALSDSDLVPVLKDFVFTGERLLAANEKIALSVLKRCGFRGTIAGTILLDQLARSSAATLALLPNGGDEGLLRLGDDSKLALPSRPIDEAESALRLNGITTPPQQSLVAGVSAEFCRGIAYCLRAVSEYATVPDQLGVTVIADGRELRLFASDRKTVVHAKLHLPQLPTLPVPQRSILPAQFCEQLLRLAAQARTTRLALADDCAWFMADEVLLFGRLIATRDPLDFDNTLKRFVPPDLHDKAIRIPQQLAPALRRAARVSDIKGAEIKTRITVRGGQATLCSRSQRGMATDQLELRGHPDIDIWVNACLLLTGLRGAERLLLSERVGIFLSNGGDKLYLVSVYEEDEDRPRKLKQHERW